MAIHELKILPEYFEEVCWKNKPFELRKNDRNFQIGDWVRLKEWNDGKYTGKVIDAEITYVLKDVPEYGLMDGYCILGLGGTKTEWRMK